MPDAAEQSPSWLARWMAEAGIGLWGVADLKGMATPADAQGRRLPRAVSWAIPVDPDIMAAVADGPTQAYADAYVRINRRINDLAASLADAMRSKGIQAAPLAASQRTDPEGIKGDFPHKTAATRAGLGWIGRHCQLITRPYGSWVRLGTVFTDLDNPPATPIERSYCGRCRRCVTACPAGALAGGSWIPGLPREGLLDAAACDGWKKAHFMQYRRGHICGICSAVCPYGRKALKRFRTAAGAAALSTVRCRPGGGPWP